MDSINNSTVFTLPCFIEFTKGMGEKGISVEKLKNRLELVSVLVQLDKRCRAAYEETAKKVGEVYKAAKRYYGSDDVLNPEQLLAKVLCEGTPFAALNKMETSSTEREESLKAIIFQLTARTKQKEEFQEFGEQNYSVVRAQAQSYFKQLRLQESIEAIMELFPDVANSGSGPLKAALSNELLPIEIVELIFNWTKNPNATIQFDGKEFLGLNDLDISSLHRIELERFLNKKKDKLTGDFQREVVVDAKLSEKAGDSDSDDDGCIIF